jgi:hypothetical protein
MRIYFKLFLFTFFILPIRAEENLNFFDSMDVFELEWASDPQVSPDGKKIVTFVSQTTL